MNGVETVRRYFDLAENFSSDADELLEIIHPDIIATEYPNALSPRMRSRTFPEMQAGLKAGGTMLKWQRFDIQRSFECNAMLIVETQWTGEMKISAGPLKEGRILTAHICFFFEFQNGRIIRHRNYDCYEAF
ncbi:MAG: hypothetical protein JWQ98_377 [Chlorobi bacterium]|nr:hypothetical protein [Chlorobiota bacterium]